MMIYFRRRKRSEEFEVEKQPAKRFKLIDGSASAADALTPPPARRSVIASTPAATNDACGGGVDQLMLSETVKRRRKMLALRSPFRNLLKKTLVRNQQNTRKRTQSALF